MTELPTTIFLSPPDVGELERELLLDAFDSNWLAPLGPHVDAFEAEMRQFLGGGVWCVALSSGSAALHLALVAAGVGEGDEVVTSTLTFAATANAIRYVGARPVFVDVDPATWQLDPDRFEHAVRARARAGRPPAAVIPVDLYGHCADYDPLTRLCREFDIVVIEDAAEALGSHYRGQAAGTLGKIGTFSFNGNKIITTSGGGMLVTSDEQVAERVRYLANQAREPVAHYEHGAVGYNYRLSNLLAAVGRGQLASIAEKIRRRREIHERYAQLLRDRPGVEVLRAPAYGSSNYWLTTLTIDPEQAGYSTDDVRAALRRNGVESRPVWKPLHLQPAFSDHGGDAPVAEDLFRRGLCLPSGSALADDQIDWIVDRGFGS